MLFLISGSDTSTTFYTFSYRNVWVRYIFLKIIQYYQWCPSLGKRAHNVLPTTVLPSSSLRDRDVVYMACLANGCRSSVYDLLGLYVRVLCLIGKWLLRTIYLLTIWTYETLAWRRSLQPFNWFDPYAVVVSWDGATILRVFIVYRKFCEL